MLKMSFLALGTPTGDEGYYPPYLWGAECDGDERLSSSCTPNPLRTVRGAGKCSFFVVVTPFHAFLAAYVKKMVILGPGPPPPNSEVPDIIVTLPSGGLTFCQSVLHCRAEFFRDQKNFLKQKKIVFFAYPPPYFGDAEHTGNIHFVQSHSFTLLSLIFFSLRRFQVFSFFVLELCVRMPFFSGSVCC